MHFGHCCGRSLSYLPEIIGFRSNKQPMPFIGNYDGNCSTCLIYLQSASFSNNSVITMGNDLLLFNTVEIWIYFHLSLSYLIYVTLCYRCMCHKCSIAELTELREYCCCWEILSAHGKLTFDGRIDRIKCVTQHDDFVALTNTTVLKQVAPLLKHRDGKSYRKKKDTTENE